MVRASWSRRWGRHLGVALSLVAASCTDMTTPSATGVATNMPAIGVTAQSVGCAVQASDFSFEDTYASPTQGDSLVVGLAVLNYGGGTALVEVRDSSGAAVVQQTVAGSRAQGQTTVHGSPPYAVHLLFRSFTGTFTLGVAARPH